MAHNNYFTEEFDNKGRRVQIQIKQHLETKQSKFQKIDMYETVPFGKMLVLDDVIMVTDFDNFAYHEMIVHVPMNAHPHPKKVLVVGGGDGGTILEILRYKEVEEVVLCEIDEEVINISKKYFPDFAKAFADKRVKVVIEDAAKYIKSKTNYFDVACIDSSDPVGPAEILFQKEFYEDIKAILTEEGIAATQSESMYYHTDFIAALFKQNKQIFPEVAYYYTLIPTYPSGTIGFSFCSKKYDPFTKLSQSRVDKLKGLKYYNYFIHEAAFMLPEFLRKLID